MSSVLSRRNFVQGLLKSSVAVSVGSAISSCSTLDEYLLEDPVYLKNQVAIVGGGLSGLYLASKLKQNKTEYKLFEGSTRFGGRVRSLQSVDIGASLFNVNDQLTRALVNEFSLPSTTLEKNNYYLNGGMEGLTDSLLERVVGLIPYRSVRLRWKLASIEKVNSFYELTFNTPTGQKIFICKRVALAVPPSQWKHIDGLLDLPDMKWAREWLNTLVFENRIKATFAANQFNPSHLIANPISFFEDDNLYVRQILKKNKNSSWLELDIRSKTNQASLEVEKINEFLKKKMSITVNSKSATEIYFDWSSVSMIESAFFKSAIPVPEIKSSSFQLVGDYIPTLKAHSLEGALVSAARASEFLL